MSFETETQDLSTATFEIVDVRDTEMEMVNPPGVFGDSDLWEGQDQGCVGHVKEV